MNVTKKSFAKPQDQPKTRTQSAVSTPDSGVLSQDSGDSSDAKDNFEEAIMNLKALYEGTQEPSQAAAAADPKAAGKTSNGVVALKAPVLPVVEKSAAASKASVFERLSAAAAGASSAPVQEGKKSPPARQKSASPPPSDQEVTKKSTETWEKGPSPESSNPSRNVLQELMSSLPNEGGSHFNNMIGHSDLEGKGAPVAKMDKVPKSQKGNLFENFTKLDPSDKFSQDKGTGKTRSDSSEGTSVASGASPASSEKKDDSAKDSANKVASDKHSGATDKVPSVADKPLNASVLKGLAKVAAKADSGAASVSKDSVEKESASESVTQMCDREKSGASQGDKDEEKSGNDVLIDKSVKAKELQGAGGDEEADQNDAVKKSAGSPSSVLKSDSSEGARSESSDIQEKPAVDSEKGSRPVSHANNDSSPDSRKRVADETPSSEDQSSAPKRSRLGDVIGKLARTIGVPPDEVKEDKSEGEESMDSDSSEGKSDGSDLMEDDDDASSSPNQSQPTIVISPEDLDELVRQKVREYLAERHTTDMEEMTAKLEEAVANCDRYRKECKELQRRVLDLTVVQQRLERRKAATAALRSISTKNVGVQVDSSLQGGTPSPKTQKMTLVLPGTSAVTPAVIGNTTMSVVPIQPLQSNPAQRPTTIVSAPMPRPVGQQVRPLATTPVVTLTTQPVLRQMTPAPAPVYTSVTVKSLLDAKNSAVAAPSSADRRVINNTGASTVIAPKTVGTATKIAPSTPTAKQGVIDLTDDDEGSRTQQTTAPRTVQITPVSSVRPTIMPQGSMLRPVTSVQPGAPPILVSPTVGPGGSVPRPNILQVVALTSTNTPIRPGSLLTVMSQPPVRPTVSALPSPSVRPSVRPSVATPIVPQTVPASRPAVVTVPALASRPAPNPAPLKVFSPPTSSKVISPGHPAPLPPTPAVDIAVGAHSAPPPQPSLKISRVSQGIVLSWTMNLTDGHAQIKSYQLYAYQESAALPSTSLWKKVGDVNALPLPMACTLTQFQEGNKYHFAVRAQDVYDRLGEFSEPSAIHLTPR